MPEVRPRFVVAESSVRRCPRDRLAACKGAKNLAHLWGHALSLNWSTKAMKVSSSDH